MKRKPRTRTHRQMAEAWMKDPEFKAAYDELETDFALHTALSANMHSPTLATLKKYARAVGCKLEVHLVPSKVR